jgi:hypothetical protein
MAKSSIVDVWFYVDPETESIDSVICWFPLGMSVRTDSDWQISDKEEAGIYDRLAKHDVYQLDWDTDPLIITEDYDFDDYENEHKAIKLYDKGELTFDILKDHSEKIISSSEYEPEDDLKVED